MTNKRLIAIYCFSCLLFTMLCGQQQESLNDSVNLSQEHLHMLETLAADSAGSELMVPNVFTPNGDGVNDYFEVTTDGTTVYEFTIFTRIGTQIYHTVSPRIFWDGRSLGGKELSEGVYYYVIEEEGGPEQFNKAGFMQLFR